MIEKLGGINQACRCGGTWVWMKRCFNIGSIVGILGISGLRNKERSQKWWKRVVSQKKPKSVILQLEVNSVVSGYGRLVVEIYRKVSKSSAVVWQTWTNNIPIQRTKCLLLAAELLLQLKVCQFGLPRRKVDLEKGKKRVFVPGDESKLIAHLGISLPSQFSFKDHKKITC